MPIRALIVDDQPDIRLLLRTYIQASQGMTVVGEFATGTEALELIERLDPEIVVLDQMMPGMSGLETARRILEQRPGQAILLCSAFLDEDVRARADAIGIRLCMPKIQIDRIAGYVEEAIA
ncbi:MAG: response regulator transcription factor [Actinomycetota bacterium]|nr:response regulator transcription factor [Actinomycetota bacterium]